MECHVLNFGKHAGRTFKEVLSDAGYCQWVLSKETASGQFKQLQDFLRAAGQHPNSSTGSTETATGAVRTVRSSASGLVPRLQQQQQPQQPQQQQEQQRPPSTLNLDEFAYRPPEAGRGPQPVEPVAHPSASSTAPAPASAAGCWESPTRRALPTSFGAAAPATSPRSEAWGSPSSDRIPLASLAARRPVAAEAAWDSPSQRMPLTSLVAATAQRIEVIQDSPMSSQQMPLTSLAAPAPAPAAALPAGFSEVAWESPSAGRRLPTSFAAPAPAPGGASAAAAAAADPPWQRVLPAASSSSTAPAPGGPQEPEKIQTPQLQLNVELCNLQTMRLSPAERGSVPKPVWTFLTQMGGMTKLGASNREWLYQRKDHDAIMKKVKSTLIGAKVVETPKWALNAIEGRKVEATATEEAEVALQDFLKSVPEELQEDRPMMEFQKEGIKFGISRGGRCLLGDEMGLGKTLQALVIIAHYAKEWPALIIVPSALRLVWREQALTWLPHILEPKDVQVLDKGKLEINPAARLVIVGYDLLQRHPQYQVRADGRSYEVAIIDEAHYIKSTSAKRTEAVLKIVQQTKRCVMISGTPAVNNSEDMFTQIKALLPEHVPSQGRFCERYCNKRTIRIRGRYVPKWDGAKNQDELYTLLTTTIMIRRLKKDVLTQLPAKRRQRIVLMAAKLDAKKMKELRGLFGDWQPTDDEDDDEGHRKAAPEIMEAFKLTAEAKVGGVQDYIEYLLGNDVKFLLFGHHMTMLDGVEERVKSLGTKYVRIDGSTPAEKRQKAVEQFQNDDATRVAVLSITACGQGLTLTAAHTVVFGELYWVPGQMVQAEDRVHRIGQENKVDVHYCIAEGTLDDRMFNMLNRKAKYTTAILNGKAQHLDAYNKKQAESPVLTKKRKKSIIDSLAAASTAQAEAAAVLESDAAAGGPSTGALGSSPASVASPKETGPPGEEDEEEPLLNNKRKRASGASTTSSKQAPKKRGRPTQAAAAAKKKPAAAAVAGDSDSVAASPSCVLSDDEPLIASQI